MPATDVIVTIVSTSYFVAQGIITPDTLELEARGKEYDGA